jgi:hypothetical protein
VEQLAAMEVDEGNSNANEDQDGEDAEEEEEGEADEGIRSFTMCSACMFSVFETRNSYVALPSTNFCVGCTDEGVTKPQATKQPKRKRDDDGMSVWA